MDETPIPETTKQHDPFNSKLCDLAQDYLAARDALDNARAALDRAAAHEAAKRKALFDTCKMSPRSYEGIVFKTRAIMFKEDGSEPTVTWVMVLDPSTWIWDGRA